MDSQRNALLALKTLIRTYGIGFNIEPGEVDVCGNVVQVTFHLKFSGHHGSGGSDGPVPCAACSCVLRTLLEVAGAFQKFHGETFEQERYDCENRVHYIQGNERNHVVALGLEMIVRRSYARARNGWALSFLDHVSTALTELGCRRDPIADTTISRPGFQPGKAESLDDGSTRATIRATRYERPRSA